MFKGIDKEEVMEVVRDLKKHWKAISKDMTKHTKKTKKTVRKATPKKRAKK